MCQPCLYHCVSDNVQLVGTKDQAEEESAIPDPVFSFEPCLLSVQDSPFIYAPNSLDCSPLGSFNNGSFWKQASSLSLTPVLKVSMVNQRL